MPRVRVLLIAPTRALVNDLTARIEGSLNRLDVTCGRQTSESQGQGQGPVRARHHTRVVRLHACARRPVARRQGGGSPACRCDVGVRGRGTSVRWKRPAATNWLGFSAVFRRLRRLNVEQATDARPPALQLCAGSATVSDPEGLAGRLLGTQAEVVRVEGTREVEVFGPPDASGWDSARAVDEVAALCDRLAPVPSAEFAEEAGRRIWQALSNDDEYMRKALVFVPTRQLCDTFPLTSPPHCLDDANSRSLRTTAACLAIVESTRNAAFPRPAMRSWWPPPRWKSAWISADVDLVALIGAPPDTRSLLQRIGRAGRRIGRTRVLALPPLGDRTSGARQHAALGA